MVLYATRDTGISTSCIGESIAWKDDHSGMFSVVWWDSPERETP